VGQACPPKLASDQLRERWWVGRVGLAIAAAALCLAAAAPPPKLTGGNGTLYIGGWPNKIFVIDEATEKVTGTIDVATGDPTRMVLSKDRKRFYLVNAVSEQVEIIDIASKKSTDHFTLSEGVKKVRIRSLIPDPLDRFVIMLVKTAEKKIDRFDISPPALVVYDLKEHKISRTIPWPNNEEREFVNIMMSPDGKLLYFFADDVLIYDTTEFKQVDKWELSRPAEEGMGRFDFGPRDVTYEEPGFYSGIFVVQDPVQNRRIMGVARVNLAAKSVDFSPLGPARPVGFSLAPDRKRAYGLLQEIGHYEFWTFDLEQHKLGAKTEFSGRPRMALRTSSNGKVLYIYQAGNTIDMYEASTYKYLRTLTLDADTTTELFVVPPTPPAGSGTQQP
jgi:DNA-binding beta-propeller fold protein YncE